MLLGYISHKAYKVLGTRSAVRYDRYCSQYALERFLVPDSYVHLHAHSCFSLLDGLARIDDLLVAAKAAEMPALALTDHGTMFAAIEFFQKAQQAGIKPILGCEVYVADRPLDERPGPGSADYHLVLLA